MQALPSTDPWQAFVQPHTSETWLSAPWWFVEHYFYRRILQAVSYASLKQDPFQAQKDKALAAAEAVFTSALLPLSKSGR